MTLPIQLFRSEHHADKTKTVDSNYVRNRQEANFDTEGLAERANNTSSLGPGDIKWNNRYMAVSKARYLRCHTTAVSVVVRDG